MDREPQQLFTAEEAAAGTFFVKRHTFFGKVPVLVKNYPYTYIYIYMNAYAFAHVYMII